MRCAGAGAAHDKEKRGRGGMHRRLPRRRRAVGRAAFGSAWCARERASRERARAALELGATRGGEVQQEVARGGRKRRAAVLQQRSRAGEPEEEEEGRVQGDLFGIFKNLRVLTVK
jgi:hypothetical protein